ncbi:MULTISPECIES: PadR family transcriptional regulator [Nocardiopsis]|uniref:PadR family transcriptional regulator n=1 Tax=Nocardiopsis sinuspersici TaxID=501010 RepID=A0A1V3C1X9_9ACTN|nr:MULTISPECIES: PadR family transcriptional regulator [Nocardiopsis]OOC54767.1 PadR family transcriptional regulator [Nocardiopsis sinuspersici]
MSAMALPGPWSWDARGPRRARRPWGRRSDTARSGRPGRHGTGHRGNGHGGERAEFGPVPPEPPTPPGVPPWGGGQFGPGHPFGGFGPGGGLGPGGGRGGRGGGRRGGGHRAKRGDVRTGILLLLAEEPRSGYEIIREGRDRSGGMWRPSPGSVYPMLQQLEDEGLVARQKGEGRRRPYALTEEGAAHLEEHGAGLTPPWDAGADAYADSRSRYEEVGALAYQLTAAAAQVAQAGSADQLERAKRLLAETRRGLYLILAEEDEDPGGGDDDTGL